MNTLKIPLTENLKTFVETETAVTISSASDFVLALVKDAQKKRAWEKAEELVLEGMQTPARPLTDEDWEKLYKRIHQANSVVAAEMSANIIRAIRRLPTWRLGSPFIAKDSPKKCWAFLKAVEKAIGLLADFRSWATVIRSPRQGYEFGPFGVSKAPHFIVRSRTVLKSSAFCMGRDLEALFIS